MSRTSPGFVKERGSEEGVASVDERGPDAVVAEIEHDEKDRPRDGREGEERGVKEEQARVDDRHPAPGGRAEQAGPDGVEPADGGEGPPEDGGVGGVFGSHGIILPAERAGHSRPSPRAANSPRTWSAWRRRKVLRGRHGDPLPGLEVPFQRS